MLYFVSIVPMAKWIKWCYNNQPKQISTEQIEATTIFWATKTKTAELQIWPMIALSEKDNYGEYMNHKPMDEVVKQWYFAINRNDVSKLVLYGIKSREK